LEKLIPLLIGSLLLIVGILRFFKTVSIIRNSISIQGVIVHLKKGRRFDGIQTFYPIIEYYDQHNDTTGSIETDVGFPEGKFLIGQKIDIWYSTDGKKQEFLIKSWFVKWGGLLCAGIGIILICAWVTGFFVE
jgi:hypothetical protein